MVSWLSSTVCSGTPCNVKERKTVGDVQPWNCSSSASQSLSLWERGAIRCILVIEMPGIFLRSELLLSRWGMKRRIPRHPVSVGHALTCPSNQCHILFKFLEPMSLANIATYPGRSGASGVSSKNEARGTGTHLHQAGDIRKLTFDRQAMALRWTWALPSNDT